MGRGCGILLLILPACVAPDLEAQIEATRAAYAQPVLMMTKVVFEDVSPGVERGSYAAGPRTLYRVAPRWGRLEHPLDPATGERPLAIVNEPHFWVIDRNTGAARYVRDPGPSFVFRAPVIPPGEMPEDAPRELGFLEFGLEREFIEAVEIRNATPERERNPFEVEIGDFRVEIRAAADSDRLGALLIYRGGALIRAFDYSEHCELPADMSLFLPPKGTKGVPLPVSEVPSAR